jgi:glycine hydroxymethyltransferase
MIMVTRKGLKKDPNLAKKIDQAIFPRLQGGPHDHQTAAIAVALGEAMKPSFKTYGHQVVKNAKALAKALLEHDIELISNGTDNHMILIKCGKGRGVFLQDALDAAGITLNKNTIPKDPSSPFYPSGVRLGTPFVTVRGMKEKEMKKIADWIAKVMEEIKDFEFPSDPPYRRAGKKEIKPTLEKFRKFVAANKNLKKIKGEVKKLCAKFPLYRNLK